MRILQVVGLISPTNEYGGPTRVALGQAAALREAGHDVILAAGTWGFDTLPSDVAGAPVRLFPATTFPPGGGLKGLTAPGMIPWLRSAMRGADVVHVHLARDLLTLPAARLAGLTKTPYVVQTHGMVIPSSHPMAAPLDALMTKRVLRDAGRVFYLTDAEDDGLRAVAGPDLALERLRNGIAVPPAPAFHDGDDLDVLYLARVQQRKRPLDFVAMARTLGAEFPRARFTMVGPDEGQGEAVRSAITSSGLGDRLRWVGAVGPDETADYMRRAQIYVLPSVDEPYPMSVLEALATALPVVITDTCGLADLVSGGDAGFVTAAGAEPVTDAVRRLLADVELRRRMSAAAHATAQRELAMPAVTGQLVEAYRALTTR